MRERERERESEREREREREDETYFVLLKKLIDMFDQEINPKGKRNERHDKSNFFKFI